MRALAAMIAVCGAALPAVAAQPAGVQAAATKVDPVPVEIALHDLHDAYKGVTADAIQVQFRAPGGAERSDELVVRIDAGPEHVRRLRLELGPLRLAASDGKATLVNTNVPGKYFQREYAEPLTPAWIAGLIPPVPIPELELAAHPQGAFAAPTPYTVGVTWTSAAIETSIRGRFLTLSGSASRARITVAANPDTGRLVRLTAKLVSHDGESTLELTMRPLEPGDPSSWAIGTEGRQSVGALSELRPAAAPSPAQVQRGQQAPDLTLSNPDHSRWSLAAALSSAAEAAAPKPPPSLVLILFRAPGGAEQESALSAAKAAGSALERIRESEPVVGAAGVVIELGDFTPERWQEAREAWSAGAAQAPPLLWASSGAQSIDRFVPGAQAVALVIAPDRTLRAAIPLDPRAPDAAGVDEDIRAALSGPP